MRNQPPYRVRISSRAKHAQLHMSLHEGLVVVVPKGYDIDRIPDLLAEKKRWIDRTSKRLADQRKRIDIAPSGTRPEDLVLRSIGETWRVAYRQTASPRVRVVERPGSRLWIYECDSDLGPVFDALRRWLRRKAHRHLKPWLRHLAEEQGFKMRRIFIKSQRTRWGSCSQQKNINLNMKLLFIPEALVHYVLLHELCHTVHLNHSKEYWSLLAQFAPDYAKQRAELRAAWQYVPAWVDG